MIENLHSNVEEAALSEVRKMPFSLVKQHTQEENKSETSKRIWYREIPANKYILKIEPKFQYSPEVRQFFLGCSKAELSLGIITSAVLVLKTMDSLSMCDFPVWGVEDSKQ